MITAGFFALALTVPVQPAKPTVGEPIRVDFSKHGDSVRLQTLPAETEIVSTNGAIVTLRAFSTGTLMLDGVVTRGREAIRFRNLPVTVSSVLSSADDLAPAPLVPPKPLPENRTANVAIILAAVAALISAVALWLRHRGEVRSGFDVIEDTSSSDELEELLRSWPARLDDAFLARVADVVRRRVSRSDAELSLSLTSRELLEAAPVSHQQALRPILEAGDRAKFSPFGAGGVSAAGIRTSVEQIAGETL